MLYDVGGVEVTDNGMDRDRMIQRAHELYATQIRSSQSQWVLGRQVYMGFLKVRIDDGSYLFTHDRGLMAFMGLLFRVDDEMPYRFEIEEP